MNLSKPAKELNDIKNNQKLYLTTNLTEEDKEITFPYSYNPNNKIPNYLDTKKR